MEKEGRVTPAEPPCHSGRRTESAERQGSGSNRHVTRPNPPRLSQHGPKGEGAPSRGGSALLSCATVNGSKSARTKQSGGGLKWSPPSDVIGIDSSWRAKSFQAPSATTKSNDPRAQSCIAANDSADAQRRATAWRDSRSAKTPTPARADLAQFEVKMSDFPQLDAGPPRAREESRGPKATAEGRRPASESNSPWPDQQKAAGGSRIPPESRQSDGGTAANRPPAATLWAKVASQPPKENVRTPKETAARLPEEATAAGRKKRKKKKAAKEADGGAEAEPSTLRQEPPKFEDEEEFPGLAPAATRSVRLASGRKTESRQDAAQTPPSEAEKKGQISGKKSKAPVQLDIGNMLSVLEDKHKSQKVKHNIIAVGGGLPVIHKQVALQKRTPRQQDKIAHNPLDSTSPLVKKGKQREVPKAKKPTALKKVILKEREERKQRRLLEETAVSPQRHSAVAAHAAEDERCDAELTAEAVCAVSAGDEQPPNESGDERRSLPRDSAVPDGPKIHSRKFREYCSQMLSKDVDQCASSLLKELVRFQDRLYQKDPMKARMKRRVVMGLREVLKHLKLHKVKCVIISPNCERVQSKGGLDEALHKIIETCRQQEVPFVFALSRRALGRCVNKIVPVSLVGIFNYDGAQDYYHQMIELSSEARRAYEEMLASAERDVLDLSEEPDSREPGYGQPWRKLLEKESDESLNFDAWPDEDKNEDDQT
ncbi:selenocysteine insertion sequence-binding protein 2-like isoform X2 [Hippocampus zosterae]|uniref:selenocysteine insertion sequence-binding protein 2-like isoform X2 n=1 Tax=Hippocampus zosterae TaxID=109293 RepID=UPI00223E8C44|nr:selenocysteine insertion sequence-binding protein 2-like isoform X2 [Hippocampus zosterae]